MIDGWKKIIDKEYHTVFAKTKGHGVVTISKIPIVDVNTIKTTGYSYSIGSSKKHSRWKHAKSYDESLTVAKKIMRRF